MNRVFTIFCLLMMLVFTGCIETINGLLQGNEQHHQVEPEVAATFFGEPKVRPGIVLEISVTAAGSLAFETKQYQVDSEGKIMMSLIGAIQCKDLTLIGLSEKITELYRQYLQEPQVTAVFVYVPGKGMISPWGSVTVLGEVNRPGPVDMPSTQDLTVTRALALAGNTTRLADNSRITLSHCDENGIITKTRVDLVEIGREGRVDKDLKLRAGDTLWVPMSYY